MPENLKKEAPIIKIISYFARTNTAESAGTETVPEYSVPVSKSVPLALKVFEEEL